MYSKTQLRAKYVVARKLRTKNMNSRKVQGTVGMRRDPPGTAGGNPLELGSGAVGRRRAPQGGAAGRSRAQ